MAFKVYGYSKQRTSTIPDPKSPRMTAIVLWKDLVKIPVQNDDNSKIQLSSIAEVKTSMAAEFLEVNYLGQFKLCSNLNKV